MQDLRLVYDLLFGVAWATLKSFGKAKRNQTGMIAVLHTGTEPAYIRTYTASYQAAGLIKAMEEYKRRWQILVSSQGVVQGFRGQIL
jgi:hypothetical protein